MQRQITLLTAALIATASFAKIDGSLDPDAVVAAWTPESEISATQIININFSDTIWPNAWAGETGRDCPSFVDGGYVNAVIEVPANGGTDVSYPVLFHNCTFATKVSYDGYGGATAAFSKQYYLGEKATGNAPYQNNWTAEGHTTYLEDNIRYAEDGTTPIYGEAGFVQMCRDASDSTSLHGWMEIDHIPYIERIQWSFSSTSWGRGIKCDYKVGDGEWQPLTWLGSEKQKQGYTSFSDQGYFLENVINASDVSIRWRVWDGDTTTVKDDGTLVYNTPIDPLAQKQAPRVHKIKIYGNEITAEQAAFARENKLSDVGELSDLTGFSNEVEKAADSPTGDLIAFPSAEGFGKLATGGRGGEVVYVTSLADDGSEGTLRWAFAQHADKPITIVFAVSGQIALQSELKVSRNDWTLAGQTAPGDGIVITHNIVNFGGSQNFIVRNIRFRCGSKDATGTVNAEQACGSENCYNYIFDHCTFGWSVEENMNTADSHFLTVQYSIVHEGLYNAGHSKGARGYGAQWGGSPATYHHNLLAHNSSRSPRFNGARGTDYVVFLEYINNVNYNWGRQSSVYGGENTADVNAYNEKNSAHECNFINNYYKPGPAYPGTNSYFFVSSYARDGATSWAPAKWYVSGNIMENNDAANTNNWSAVSVEVYTQARVKSTTRITPTLNYWKYSLAGNSGTYDPNTFMIPNDSIQEASVALATVLANAGTINRDKVEQRIIEEVKNGTATYGANGIIDLETDAEGFYAYATDYTTPTDTDRDGMPDEWETANGFNPNEADNNTATESGYTALEIYLNGLMGGISVPANTAIGSIRYSSPTFAFDAETQTVYVSGNAIGATLRIYNTAGQLIAQQQIDAQQTKLADLPKGVLLFQLTGKNLTPRALKTIL